MAKRKRKRRDWTDAEIEFLRQNYGPMSAAQMAKELNRPESSVFAKLRQLKMEKHSNQYCRATKGIKPGDRVRVTLPGIPGLKSNSAQGRGKSRRTHTGRVLQVHERYILVQLPAWKECINLGTIIAGEAWIALLEGRQAV